MKISKSIKIKFHRNLRKWYLKNQRTFSWRYQVDPYKILIAEVLLQKTNAAKVEPVYREFTKKYPDPKKLSKAKNSDVKKILKSLGLFYRAERLIAIGLQLLKKHKGKVPKNFELLLKLNGLGKYVSSAVMSFAFNKRVPIVDSNVVRLFERIFGFKSSKNRPRDDIALWHFAESLLPAKKVKDYNYALLDFNALICTTKNPKHGLCPLKNICVYYQRKRIKKIAG